MVWGYGWRVMTWTKFLHNSECWECGEKKSEYGHGE